jgi:hypothetical protein
MEAEIPLETYVNIYHTTQRHFPEASNIHTCKRLKNNTEKEEYVT